MNWTGLITGVACFAMIGLFHPIVIYAEYYFTKNCWPVFLVLGAVSVGISFMVDNAFVSILFGSLGCSLLWSIIELFEQEDRIVKGWFPANPKHIDRYRKKGLQKGKDITVIFTKQKAAEKKAS